MVYKVWHPHGPILQICSVAFSLWKAAALTEEWFDQVSTRRRQNSSPSPGPSSRLWRHPGSGFGLSCSESCSSKLFGVVRVTPFITTISWMARDSRAYQCLQRHYFGIIPFGKKRNCKPFLFQAHKKAELRWKAKPWPFYFRPSSG